METRLVIIIFLLLLSPVLADVGGINFAMTGQDKYVIPVFRSEDEAIEFAIRTKWREPLLQQMITHMNDLWKNSSDRHSGWLLAGQKQDGNIYWEQWKRAEIVVRIMSRYKERGIKGDPAQVGSSFVASSIPWPVKEK